MAKILIIEDDRVLNSAYQMILTKEGHDVQTAFDGQEGLTKANEFEPDVILLDLLMPTMGGISFLEEYNAPAHSGTTVIVLSNMGDEQLVEKARELGAFKYIVKAHTTPGQLSVMVNHIINKKEKTTKEA